MERLKTGSKKTTEKSYERVTNPLTMTVLYGSLKAKYDYLGAGGIHEH